MSPAGPSLAPWETRCWPRRYGRATTDGGVHRPAHRVLCDTDAGSEGAHLERELRPSRVGADRAGPSRRGSATGRGPGPGPRPRSRGGSPPTRARCPPTGARAPWSGPMPNAWTICARRRRRPARPNGVVEGQRRTSPSRRTGISPAVHLHDPGRVARGPAGVEPGVRGPQRRMPGERQLTTGVKMRTCSPPPSAVQSASMTGRAGNDRFLGRSHAAAYGPTLSWVWHIVAMGAMRSRAAVVALRDDQLLVIKRAKQGRRYAVLPGGGVELIEPSRCCASRANGGDWLVWPGAAASLDAAARRSSGRLLLRGGSVGDHGDGRSRGSEDVTREHPEPCWIRTIEPDLENLHPAEIRALIRDLAWFVVRHDELAPEAARRSFHD